MSLWDSFPWRRKGPEKPFEEGDKKEKSNGGGGRELKPYLTESEADFDVRLEKATATQVYDIIVGLFKAYGHEKNPHNKSKYEDRIGYAGVFLAEKIRATSAETRDLIVAKLTKLTEGAKAKPEGNKLINEDIISKLNDLKFAVDEPEAQVEPVETVAQDDNITAEQGVSLNEFRLAEMPDDEFEAEIEARNWVGIYRELVDELSRLTNMDAEDIAATRILIMDRITGLIDYVVTSGAKVESLPEIKVLIDAINETLSKYSESDRRNIENALSELIQVQASLEVVTRKGSKDDIESQFGSKATPDWLTLSRQAVTSGDIKAFLEEAIGEREEGLKTLRKGTKLQKNIQAQVNEIQTVLEKVMSGSDFIEILKDLGVSLSTPEPQAAETSAAGAPEPEIQTQEPEAKAKPKGNYYESPEFASLKEQVDVKPFEEELNELARRANVGDLIRRIVRKNYIQQFEETHSPDFKSKPAAEQNRIKAERTRQIEYGWEFLKDLVSKTSNARYLRSIQAALESTLEQVSSKEERVTAIQEILQSLESRLAEVQVERPKAVASEEAPGESKVEVLKTASEVSEADLEWIDKIENDRDLLKLALFDIPNRRNDFVRSKSFKALSRAEKDHEHDVFEAQMERAISNVKARIAEADKTKLKAIEKSLKKYRSQDLGPKAREALESLAGPLTERQAQLIEVVNEEVESKDSDKTGRELLREALIDIPQAWNSEVQTREFLALDKVERDRVRDSYRQRMESVVHNIKNRIAEADATKIAFIEEDLGEYEEQELDPKAKTALAILRQSLAERQTVPVEAISSEEVENTAHSSESRDRDVSGRNLLRKALFLIPRAWLSELKSKKFRDADKDYQEHTIATFQRQIDEVVGSIQERIAKASTSKLSAIEQDIREYQKPDLDPKVATIVEDLLRTVEARRAQLSLETEAVVQSQDEASSASGEVKEAASSWLERSLALRERILGIIGDDIGLNETRELKLKGKKPAHMAEVTRKEKPLPHIKVVWHPRFNIEETFEIYDKSLFAMTDHEGGRLNIDEDAKAIYKLESFVRKVENIGVLPQALKEEVVTPSEEERAEDSEVIQAPEVPGASDERARERIKDNLTEAVSTDELITTAEIGAQAAVNMTEAEQEQAVKDGTDKIVDELAKRSGLSPEETTVLKERIESSSGSEEISKKRVFGEAAKDFLIGMGIGGGVRMAVGGYGLIAALAIGAPLTASAGVAVAGGIIGGALGRMARNAWRQRQEIRNSRNYIAAEKKVRKNSDFSKLADDVKKGRIKPVDGLMILFQQEKELRENGDPKDTRTQLALARLARQRQIIEEMPDLATQPGYDRFVEYKRIYDESSPESGVLAERMRRIREKEEEIAVANGRKVDKDKITKGWLTGALFGGIGAAVGEYIFPAIRDYFTGGEQVQQGATTAVETQDSEALQQQILDRYMADHPSAYGIGEATVDSGEGFRHLVDEIEASRVAAIEQYAQSNNPIEIARLKYEYGLTPSDVEARGEKFYEALLRIRRHIFRDNGIGDPHGHELRLSNVGEKFRLAGDRLIVRAGNIFLVRGDEALNLDEVATYHHPDGSEVHSVVDSLDKVTNEPIDLHLKISDLPAEYQAALAQIDTAASGTAAATAEAAAEVSSPTGSRLANWLLYAAAAGLVAAGLTPGRDKAEKTVSNVKDSKSTKAKASSSNSTVTAPVAESATTVSTTEAIPGDSIPSLFGDTKEDLINEGELIEKDGKDTYVIKENLGKNLDIESVTTYEDEDKGPGKVTTVIKRGEVEFSWTTDGKTLELKEKSYNASSGVLEEKTYTGNQALSIVNSFGQFDLDSLEAMFTKPVVVEKPVEVAQTAEVETVESGDEKRKRTPEQEAELAARIIRNAQRNGVFEPENGTKNLEKFIKEKSTRLKKDAPIMRAIEARTVLRGTFPEAEAGALIREMKKADGSSKPGAYRKFMEDLVARYKMENFREKDGAYERSSRQLALIYAGMLVGDLAKARANKDYEWFNAQIQAWDKKVNEGDTN